jgi:hypothetical protein
MAEEIIEEQKEIPEEESALTNIASKIPEEKRREIALEIIDHYNIDLESRSDWEEKRRRWYELWACVREKKTDPWEGASNVCVPMMATACNQFHARAYQSIFAPPGMVKCVPIGEHDFNRAKNVEKYLNWQTLYEMEEYEEVFDKTLQRLPINGTEFKKIQYSKTLDRPVSDDIRALDFVLPYRTKTLATARRKTHRIWLHYDELQDRDEEGLYIDFEKVNKVPGDHPDSESGLQDASDAATGESSDKPEEKPHLILETHKKYDLGDGRVPYVFTVDVDSETLLRCTKTRIENGTGIIKDLEYFTDYHFIPNPEGFYSFGFGHFLEPLNEMANTAFNQIFDSGRLTNQPFGFYGRRAGFKKRKIKLKPGSMYEVEDAKQVYFPSMQRVDQVLFMVLGLIQQYTEQFTSTSDYLMGRESKGTKTPTAHGTLAIIEQGLVTFAVMTKRIFRSLKGELRLLLSLNQLFAPEQKQYRVMEDLKNIPFPIVKRADFDAIYDVIPMGDPSYASKESRRREAVEAYQIGMQNPLIVGNPKTGEGANMKAIYELTKGVFDTYDTVNTNKILPDLPEEPLPPESENAMMMQGDTVEPNPQENVKEHLEAHTRFKKSPWYAEMPDDYKVLVDGHIKATMMMVRMIEQSRQNLGGAPPVEPPKQGGNNGQDFGTFGGGNPPMEG